MKLNRSSKTAFRAAISRAAHQLLDSPVVFEDPIALRIIGAENVALIHAGGWQFESKMARRLRGFFAARSRFAEDELNGAIKRGVRQYVILGAGLDTFAFRNPYGAEKLRVFEVDHPDTQSWKRQQLTAAKLAVPAALTYVPVNFEIESLDVKLREAGFRATEPAFFSWLGVSMYLTPDTVMETLKFVASVSASGGGIVFDYITPLDRLGIHQRLRAFVLNTWLRAIGEPWKSHFTPEAMMRSLKLMDFTTIEDMGTDQIDARYFKKRVNGEMVSGPGRLLCAQR